MPAAPKVDPVLQDHLDFLFPRGKMLRPEQVASGLGVDQVTVRRLFDRIDDTKAPQLHGITLNAGAGERDTRRILRDSAILLYAARANYTPEEFLTRIAEVLGNRSHRELVRLHAYLGELVRSKS